METIKAIAFGLLMCAAAYIVPPYGAHDPVVIAHAIKLAGVK